MRKQRHRRSDYFIFVTTGGEALNCCVIFAII
jgi:hypothetical protein